MRRVCLSVLTLVACDSSEPEQGELTVRLALETRGLDGRVACFGLRVVSDGDTVTSVMHPVQSHPDRATVEAAGASCTTETEATFTVPCEVGRTYDAKGWSVGIFQGNDLADQTFTCAPGQPVCHALATCPGEVVVPMGQPSSEVQAVDYGSINIAARVETPRPFDDMCFAIRVSDGFGEVSSFEFDVCTSKFGDPFSNSIDYLASCDGTSGVALVALWIISTRPDAPPDFFNPCPPGDGEPEEWRTVCQQEVACLPNQDSTTTFALSAF